MAKHSKRVAARQAQLATRKKRPAHRPHQAEAEGTTPPVDVTPTAATALVESTEPGTEAIAPSADTQAQSRPTPPVTATFNAPRRGARSATTGPAFGARKAIAGNAYLASDLRGVAGVSAALFIVLIVLGFVLN